MAEIGIRRFDTVSKLNESVAALLRHHFELEYPAGHAVMLSGGKTPFEAYHLVASRSCIVSSSLGLFFSDERLVPVTSAESNSGNARFLVDALGLAENRVFRVHPELEPEEAAKRYDNEIRKFINGGGRITLGLLGLGVDGHTASLFPGEDLNRARGRYAVAAIAPDGIHRVSVSPDLLCKVEQIIFIVSGSGKKAVVERLLERPSSVIAGQAVAGNQKKQLWFAG